jgi:hypothetical protein
LLTRSPLDVRLGDPTPQILFEPPDVASLAAAEEAIELADAYLICDGQPLAESQKITLRAALGERADGSWAAKRVGDFGPRQGTGKTDKIASRELYGLIVVGERLQIHTAHEFPTANEAFLRMVAIFENWDDLRSKVDRVRYANGEQAIELLSGQRLKYRARTGGSGRGFAKADLLVYDEAQHLMREHVAASAPAKLANPNSQTWYAGSGGLATSAVAWSMRRSALLGTANRMAYTEKTGERVTVVDGEVVCEAPDPNDHDVWYSAIPGLGRWVTEEGVEDLRDELDELFPREGLCVWDPEPGAAGGGAFDLALWGSLVGPSPERGSDVVFALDVAPDHSTATIAAGWTLPGGLKWLQLADHRVGVEWVSGRVVDLLASWGGRLVVEQTGTAAFLLPSLPTVTESVSRRFYADACSTLDADVTAARLRHGNQQELNAAVAAARWAASPGTGQRVLARKDPRVSPCVAAALVMHALISVRAGGGWMVGV